MEKLCGRCGVTKGYEEFYIDRARKDGRTYLCRECNKAAAKKWTQSVKGDPVRKEKARQWRTDYYQNNPEAWRKHKLWQQYRIRLDEYIAMYEKQDGKCLICDKQLVKDWKVKVPLMERPQVDHDHVTGVIRGLLCFGCNLGIGHLGDSPARLRCAALYLEGR